MVCDKVPRPVINNLYHNRSVQVPAQYKFWMQESSTKITVNWTNSVSRISVGLKYKTYRVGRSRDGQSKSCKDCQEQTQKIIETPLT